MQVISEIKYILRDAGLPLHAPRFKNLLIGAFGNDSTNSRFNLLRDGIPTELSIIVAVLLTKISTYNTRKRTTYTRKIFKKKLIITL